MQLAALESAHCMWLQMPLQHAQRWKPSDLQLPAAANALHHSSSSRISWKKIFADLKLQLPLLHYI